jgi:uncharacterized protein YbgA (DUF1722 family)
MTELYYDNVWNKQYEKLVEFRRKNGHCLVPQKHQEDASLGRWVNKQRQLYVNNKLQDDRKDMLDEFGFVWVVDRCAPETWHQQYEKLVEFQRKNGHCIVPSTYQEDKSLGKWVGKQRELHSKDKLRLDRKDLLDELGFAWGGGNWLTQYEKLVEFKRKNGHCIVPINYKEDVSLGMWVNTQRQFHSKKTIRPDRKDLLDQLGFVWKAPAHSHEWDRQYEKLVDFKQNNGHCLVPKRNQEDTAFARWVEKQRHLHSKNIIRLGRKELLDELGFAWGGERWHKHYGQLVEFKRKNGHCLVPQKYQEDVALGRWVITQRQSNSNNKLRLDRKVLLDEIGFVWKGRTAGADNKIKDKFKQINGNALVACLAESEQMAARTNPIGGDIGSHGSVEKDGGWL